MILYDVDAGFGEAFGGVVVADAELEPDGFGVFGDDVVDVLGDVGGAAEDVDDVDVAWDGGEGAVDGLAEDLDDGGIVDGDGDDCVAGALNVGGDVVGGFIGIGFDAEDGDAVRTFE